MKYLVRSSTLVLALSSFLASATDIAAQADHHSRHRQYKLIDLGTLGGPSSIIVGLTGPVNNFGMVTECADTAALDPAYPNDNPYFGGDPFVQHTFLWFRIRMHDLGDLPGGVGSCGQWINDYGVVAGADLADGTHHAFVWQKGRMNDLGTVGTDACSNGKGINSWGLATGTSTDCNGNILHLLLWQKGEMVNLSALIRPGSDVTVTDLAMINDRGEIAGEGVTADGNQRAVLLVPDGDCDQECESRFVVGDIAAPQRSASTARPAARVRSLARRRHIFE